MATAKALKRNIFSLLLAACLLSGCAYRVQTSNDEANNLEAQNSVVTGSATETKEETFYHAEVIRLPVPVSDYSESYKLYYTGAGEPVITNDRIIVPLYRFYTDADAGELNIWGQGIQMSENINVVYDMNGHYVCCLQDYYPYCDSYQYGQDETGAIIGLYCIDEYDDNGDCMYYIVVVRYSQDTGEVLEEPITLFGTESPMTGAIISGQDKIVIATENGIYSTDFYGDWIHSCAVHDDKTCVGIWEEGGVYYAEFLTGAYGDETGSIVSFTYSESVGLTMNQDSKNTDNLAGMRLYQNDSGIYAATKNTLGKLDLQTGEFSRLLDWNQTDVDRSLLVKGTVRVLTEGERSQTITVLPATEENPVTDTAEEPAAASVSALETMIEESGVTEDAEETKTSLLVATVMQDQNGVVPCIVKLTPSDAQPHAGEKVVWVGGVGISESPIMAYISQYNQDPDNDVWVKVYDYSDFSSDYGDVDSEQAYQTSLANMATQVRSGVGPDIIIGTGTSAIFDNGTCLTDLNGYVDGIRGIDRSQYFDSVLRAFETNGKLYQIPLAYRVYGILGNRGYADGKESMNYQDYTTARSFLQGDASLMSYFPSDFLLTLYSQAEMSTWINYDQGTVSINHQALISMLEMMRANTIDVGVFSYDSPFYVFRATALEACQSVGAYYAAFCPGMIDSLSDYALGNVLGEQSQWYGLPGSEGCTSAIEADLTCGITSYSSQKEEAWDVISYLLSEDVQCDIGTHRDFRNDFYTQYETQIPVNKEAFVKMCNQNRPANGEYILEMPQYSDDDVSFAAIPLGSADKVMQDFISWMGKPQRRLIFDQEVLQIVLEEAENYINEYETVTEAAEAIEDRIIETAMNR